MELGFAFLSFYLAFRQQDFTDIRKHYQSCACADRQIAADDFTSSEDIQEIIPDEKLILEFLKMDVFKFRISMNEESSCMAQVCQISVFIMYFPSVIRFNDGLSKDQPGQELNIPEYTCKIFSFIKFWPNYGTL